MRRNAVQMAMQAIKEDAKQRRVEKAAHFIEKVPHFAEAGRGLPCRQPSWRSAPLEYSDLMAASIRGLTPMASRQAHSKSCCTVS